jgi:hypothetical protein
VITILVDHNVEGQAMLLLGALGTAGWLQLHPLQFITFPQAELIYHSSDREVWRFAQNRGWLLLTANRRRQGEDSLEQIIREENTPVSLPVVTISDGRRMVEKTYRERCAVRLLEIVLDLDNYRGVGRVFLP